MQLDLNFVHCSLRSTSPLLKLTREFVTVQCHRYGASLFVKGSKGHSTSKVKGGYFNRRGVVSGGQLPDALCRAVVFVLVITRYRILRDDTIMCTSHSRYECHCGRFIKNRIITYIIHNISPALKRDALEHSEHWQAKVVKVGDAKVRTYPSFPALHLITDQGAVEAVVQVTRVRCVHDFIWGQSKYLLLKDFTKMFLWKWLCWSSLLIKCFCLI